MDVLETSQERHIFTGISFSHEDATIEMNEEKKQQQKNINSEIQ